MTDKDSAVDKSLRVAKERRISLLAVIVFLVTLTTALFFLNQTLFNFFLGFTGIICLIILAREWDNVVVWWATRK